MRTPGANWLTTNATGVGTAGLVTMPYTVKNVMARTMPISPAGIDRKRIDVGEGATLRLLRCVLRHLGAGRGMRDAGRRDNGVRPTVPAPRAPALRQRHPGVG